MRVVVIIENPVLRSELGLHLHSAGYAVTSASSALEGLDHLAYCEPQAIILGYLPETTILEMITKITALKLQAPLIVVTRAGEPLGHWAARYIEAGAEDFLDLPYAREELLARVGARLRKSYSIDDRSIQVNNLQLNPHSKTASVDGVTAPLTRKEFDLIEVLGIHRGRCMSKTDLLGAIYRAEDDEPEIKIVDVFVCKIRKKLKQVGWTGSLRTVWGIGYVVD